MEKKMIEMYRRDDGFYAARELKNGELSADAHKVTAEEIMTMFTEFFGDYCRESGESKLLMQDAKGQLFVTMRVEPNKQAEKPAKTADARASGDARGQSPGRKPAKVQSPGTERKAKSVKSVKSVGKKKK
jgi:hypothetical protein